MITTAITGLKAILKYIVANNKVEASKAAIQVRLALKNGLAKGVLKIKKKKVAKKVVKKPAVKKLVKKPAAKKVKAFPFCQDIGDDRNDRDYTPGGQT